MRKPVALSAQSRRVQVGAFTFFVALLVLLVMQATAQAEPVASVFAQPQNQNGSPAYTKGVATGPDGSVFVAYDGGTEITFDPFLNPIVTGYSRLAKYSPNGTLLRDVVTIESPAAGNVGHLDTDASGRVWELTTSGDLLVISPDLSTLISKRNLRQVPTDNTDVYELGSETRTNMSGQAIYWDAVYGDIAVVDRGSNQQDVFVTGLYKNVHSFVTRLRFVSGQLQSAKVLVSSSYDTQQNSDAPGIAVNDQGTVLTTLTAPNQTERIQCARPECVPDKTVAFSADYPADGSTPRTILFGEAYGFSKGMTTDAAGGLYAAHSNYSGFQGCTNTRLVRFGANLGSYNCVVANGPLTQLGANDTSDVAISPDGTTAYLSDFNGRGVVKVTGIAPAVDATPPNTSITSGPSGTVNSSSASFAFSSSEVGSSFQCSLDGASFSPCISPKNYTSLPSGQHTFRVRAIDAAGNADQTPASRTWTVSTSTTNLQTLQEDDLLRAGYANWEFYSNQAFSGGSSSYARVAGSAATFKFTGTSVTWKTQKLPDAGITDVYLDGTKVKTFDAYSGTPQFNVTGYSKTGLANAAHTLKLVVTGRKNAASTNYYTEIDRFIVGSTTVQDRSPKVQYGPWSGATSANASGGAYRQSSSTQLVANLFDFTGPQVDVITAVGPTRGLANVQVVDANSNTIVKTVTFTMNAPTVGWQALASITGLDPTKRYYLKVWSADGKQVVVDGFRAVPYQGQQLSAASSLEGTETEKETSKGAGTAPQGSVVENASVRQVTLPR